MLPTMSDSSVSSGDRNSIPHTCVTSAEPTEQSPQPHAVSTKLNVYISYDSVFLLLLHSNLNMHMGSSQNMLKTVHTMIDNFNVVN